MHVGDLAGILVKALYFPPLSLKHAPQLIYMYAGVFFLSLPCLSTCAQTPDLAFTLHLLGFGILDCTKHLAWLG